MIVFWATLIAFIAVAACFAPLWIQTVIKLPRRVKMVRMYKYLYSIGVGRTNIQFLVGKLIGDEKFDNIYVMDIYKNLTKNPKYNDIKSSYYNTRFSISIDEVNSLLIASYNEVKLNEMLFYFFKKYNVRNKYDIEIFNIIKMENSEKTDFYVDMIDKVLTNFNLSIVDQEILKHYVVNTYSEEFKDTLDSIEKRVYKGVDKNKILERNNAYENSYSAKDETLDIINKYKQGK